MKRLIKANDTQEIKNEIQRLEKALKEAEEKRSDLDELNSKVSELFNTVSDARGIHYSPDIVDAYDNAILDIEDDIQKLKEKLTKEENFKEYVALKWDDFIQELKEKIMQINNEFNKLCSKYNISMSNNIINEMVNYSKEDIKEKKYLENVEDVIILCSLDLFNSYCNYSGNLKGSWNMDITVLVDDESFPPRWVWFGLDHENIHENIYDNHDGIDNKELFNSLPDEYQKKIIDFTNEYSQFQKRMSKEYCDFITNYFS